MENYVLEAQELTKKFGKLTAVDDLSINVPRGCLYAFLGPNGAGKSTTISMITGLLIPDSGEVWYTFESGERASVKRAGQVLKNHIGVVFQESLLDPELSVSDNIATRAKLYERNGENVERVYEELQLSKILKQRYGTLSGGQRRRVDIARALVTQPEILFLDEPTTGLDPQSRATVWETLETLRDTFKLTIFLTTHYLAEADRADIVTVIDHGKVIAEDSPEKLKSEHSSDTLTFENDDELRKAIEEKNYDVQVEAKNGQLKVRVEDTDTALNILNDNRALFDDFEFHHGSLDDVFLALTGKTLRED